MSGLRKKKLIWSVRLHLNFGSGHQKFLLVSIRGSKIRKHLSHEILCFVKVARLSWDTTMLHLKLRTTLIWIRISAQFGINQLSEGSKVHVTRIPGVGISKCTIAYVNWSAIWKRKVVHNVQNRNMTKWTCSPCCILSHDNSHHLFCHRFFRHSLRRQLFKRWRVELAFVKYP